MMRAPYCKDRAGLKPAPTAKGEEVRGRLYDEDGYRMVTSMRLPLGRFCVFGCSWTVCPGEDGYGVAGVLPSPSTDSQAEDAR